MSKVPIKISTNIKRNCEVLAHYIASTSFFSTFCVTTWFQNLIKSISFHKIWHTNNPLWHGKKFFSENWSKLVKTRKYIINKYSQHLPSKIKPTCGKFSWLTVATAALELVLSTFEGMFKSLVQYSALSFLKIKLIYDWK